MPDEPPIPIGADSRRRRTRRRLRLRWAEPGVAVAIVITVGLLFQVGSALAVHVMQSVGVIEALWMRTAFAALMLVAVRPRSFRLPRSKDRRGLAALTLALLGMNLFFYAAIDRVPLGIVVTIEFLGPLTVAMLGSRRLLDWVWIVLAAAGVAVLAGPSGSADTLGLVFAFAAAACWGSFILLAKRAVTHSRPAEHHRGHAGRLGGPADAGAAGRRGGRHRPRRAPSRWGCWSRCSRRPCRTSSSSWRSSGCRQRPTACC